MSYPVEDIMLKPTPHERILIRNEVLGSGKHVPVYVWDNLDCTWACEVGGIVFEAPTAAELLRDLAAVLEEA